MANSVAALISCSVKPGSCFRTIVDATWSLDGTVAGKHCGQKSCKSVAEEEIPRFCAKAPSGSDVGGPKHLMEVETRCG